MQVLFIIVIGSAKCLLRFFLLVPYMFAAFSSFLCVIYALFGRFWLRATEYLQQPNEWKHNSHWRRKFFQNSFFIFF